MAVLMSCAPDQDGVFPEGAYVPIERVYEGAQVVGMKPLCGASHVLHERYIGRVLSTGEINGYDDSDFTATVWDDEKDEPVTFTYATTRAYTYHLYAHVDATDEVRAKFKARQEYRARLSSVMARRNTSKARFALARTLGVEPAAIRRLEAGMGYRLSHIEARERSRYSSSLAHEFGFFRDPNPLDRVLKLATSFRAGKLRSAFKKKLAEQVLTWLADPAPRYPTPLSRKQLDYV